MAAQRTQQLVTFHLDDRTYGIDVSAVQEVLRNQPRTRVPLAPSAVAGLINLRGQVLTAVDLREQLDLPPRDADAEQVVVVVRLPGEAVALLVDAIGAVVDVDPDQLAPPPDTLTGPVRDVVVGVYDVAGRLVLFLNVRALAT